MFKKNTVFVIGAGASWEFGMPTGDGLAAIIREKLRLDKSEYRRSRVSDQRIAHLIEARAHILKRDISEYLTACEAIANGIEVAGSIDQFIWQHNDKPVLREVGKLAIAISLLRAERQGDGRRPNSLYVSLDNINNRLDLGQATNTWLHPFTRVLVEGVEAANLEKFGSEVTVITFNYDRGIEHYLLEALERDFLISRRKAADLVRSLKIIHVYGDLGPLPEDRGVVTTDIVPYGADVDHTIDLWSVADRLQTYTEEIRNRNALEAIRSAMSEAERIVFLGFGFAAQNMDILTPGWPLGDKSIYSTGFGLDSIEVQEVRARITSMCGWGYDDNIHIGRPEQGAYSFMKALMLPLAASTTPRPFSRPKAAAISDLTKEEPEGH